MITIGYRAAAATTTDDRIALDRRHGVEIGFCIRGGSRLESGALDLGTGHLLAKKCLATQKELVVVAPAVLSFGEAIKAVKIELALKGSQFGLAKVFGHDMIGKFFWFVNHKAASCCDMGII